MADALVLGTNVIRRAGSSPVARTKNNLARWERWLIRDTVTVENTGSSPVRVANIAQFTFM